MEIPLVDNVFHIRIHAKIQKSSKNSKTIMMNIVEIAQAIRRPVTYVFKYFGNELQALTWYDIKDAQYIIGGAHEPNKLQLLLNEFIIIYVLCPSCGNKKTELLINANGSISKSCKACGACTPIDSEHKLNSFILNRPPV